MVPKFIVVALLCLTGCAKANSSSNDFYNRRVKTHERSAYNLRDLGGLPTHSGGTVRLHMLFRTDARTPEEVRSPGGLLHAHNIRAFYDLRVLREMQTTLEQIPTLFWVHMPVETSMEGLNDECKDRTTRWVQFYVRLIQDNGTTIVRLLDALAFGDLPAAIGCSLGKDRTGVVCACILQCLGVDDHQIACDYARSTKPLMQEIDLHWQWGKHLGVEFNKFGDNYLVASPEIMLGFLDEMRRQHGSLVEGLKKIGLNQKTLQALQDRFVIPGKLPTPAQKTQAEKVRAPLISQERSIGTD